MAERLRRAIEELNLPEQVLPPGWNDSSAVDDLAQELWILFQEWRQQGGDRLARVVLDLATGEPLDLKPVEEDLILAYLDGLRESARSSEGSPRRYLYQRIRQELRKLSKQEGSITYRAERAGGRRRGGAYFAFEPGTTEVADLSSIGLTSFGDLASPEVLPAALQDHSRKALIDLARSFWSAVRPRLPGPRLLKVWDVVDYASLHYEHLSEVAFEEYEELDPPQDVLGPRPLTPEVDLYLREIAQQVRQCWLQWSDRRRAAFNLYYFSEMTQKDIAAALNVDPATISRDLREARLDSIFAPYNFDEDPAAKRRFFEILRESWGITDES